MLMMITYFLCYFMLTYNSLQHISLLKDRNLIFWLSCCCPPGSFCLPGPCNRKHQLEREHQKVRIYKEYHSVCPLVGIGTLPTPLSLASVPLPPQNRGGGVAHSPAGRGWGSPNSDDWRKSLALCLLCGAHELSQQLGTQDILISWEPKKSDILTIMLLLTRQFQETSVRAHELSQQSGTQDILISWTFRLFPSSPSKKVQLAKLYLMFEVYVKVFFALNKNCNFFEMFSVSSN